MPVRRVRASLALVILLVAGASLLAAGPALAQARNPFSVGISEGGGTSSGVMGWILSRQGYFEHALASAVRASRQDGSALPWLAGLSFVYGVLHAAGPGHGKAVLASYMVANTRALRRGIALSFLAALLQAGVAVGLVGVLSLLFHATAIGMRDGAALIEKTSYVGVAGLGLWLVLRKGRTFLAVWRTRPGAAERPTALDDAPRFASAGMEAAAGPHVYRLAPLPAVRAGFVCTAADAAHDHTPGCGHWHAPDPATLGEGFSWREAASTVVAAGARPCSGAILVLVFALSQGIFLAGIVATLVMALGTALTTAALASLAVLAKGLALRLAGADAGRSALLGRGLEVLAALVVLAVGLSLMFGVGPLQTLA